MLSASSFAIRASAFSIDFARSPALGSRSTIRLISSSTPTTPGTLPATNSASSRWYCHVAEPLSVTQPSSTVASIVLGTRPSSLSACSTEPRRSASSRPCPVRIRTLSSLRTDLTPCTRSAAFCASRFSRRLPTVPCRVTSPLSAETATAESSTLGSQRISSLTQPWSSSFDIAPQLPTLPRPRDPSAPRSDDPFGYERRASVGTLTRCGKGLEPAPEPRPGQEVLHRSAGTHRYL